MLANEREAEVLTGLSGTAAARALGERYRVACVKLGAKGAAMSFDGSIVEVGAEPIGEVDATGAGDAFDGVLLAALARGERPGGRAPTRVPRRSARRSSAETWPAGASA